MVEKWNYKEEFDEAPFIQNIKAPNTNLIGRTMRDSDGNFYEKINSNDTVPDIDSFHVRGISIEPCPYEWFNLFVPIYKKRQEIPNDVTIEDFTTWSGKRHIYQMLEQKIVNAQSGHLFKLKK